MWSVICIHVSLCNAKIEQPTSALWNSQYVLMKCNCKLFSKNEIISAYIIVLPVSECIMYFNEIFQSTKQLVI